MKIEFELNPDEALALIQICERDIMFPEVSGYVISETEKARHEWANNVRNLGYLREALTPVEGEPDYDIDGNIGFLRVTGAL